MEAFDDPRNMADAYLLRKFIPEDARILMPFTNLKSNTSIGQVIVKGYFSGSAMKFASPFYAVKYLIRKKVGFNLSLEAYQNGHPFVPNSLRECHDLFSELARWKNVPKKLGELENFENFSRFKNYLLRSWAIGKIPTEMQSFLEELVLANENMIAKIILAKAPIVIETTLANMKGDRKLPSTPFFDPEINPKLRIVNPNWFPNTTFEDIKPMLVPETNPSNIGLGEVIVLLKLLDGYYQNQCVSTFIFLIRSIYSIRILQKVAKKPLLNSWNGITGLGLIPHECLRIGYDHFRRLYLSSFQFKGLDSKLDSIEFKSSDPDWMQAYLVLQFFLFFKPPSSEVDSRLYRNSSTALIAYKSSDIAPYKDSKIRSSLRSNPDISQGVFNITTLFSKDLIASNGTPLLFQKPYIGGMQPLEPISKDLPFVMDITKWHKENTPLWPIWNIEGTDSAIKHSLEEGVFSAELGPLIFGNKDSLFHFISGYFSWLKHVHSLMTDNILGSDGPDALSISFAQIASHPVLDLFRIDTSAKELQYPNITKKLEILLSSLLELASTVAQVKIGDEIDLNFSTELRRILKGGSRDNRYRNIFRDALNSLANSNLINRADTLALIKELEEIFGEFEEKTKNGKFYLPTMGIRKDYGRRFLTVLEKIQRATTE